MSLSNKSYADRLDRGRLMQSHIAGFDPVFEPADSNLNAVNFDTYLDEVENANSAVSGVEVDLTNAASDRTPAANAIKDKAMRIKDYVGTNVVWKQWLPAIERASKMVRGVPLAKKAAPETPPAEPETPPVKVRIGAKSQLGYADVEKNFTKLISAVEKITGFMTPPGSGLSVAEMTAQRDAFSVLNKACTDAETALQDKQQARFGLYEGDYGLRDRMKSIKLGVSAQYGRKSKEFAMVKGIAL